MNGTERLLELANSVKMYQAADDKQYYIEVTTINDEHFITQAVWLGDAINLAINELETLTCLKQTDSSGC